MYFWPTNIRFMGILRDERQLKKGTLPDGAVPFKEPQNMLGVYATALVYSIPIIIFCVALYWLMVKVGHFNAATQIDSKVSLLVLFAAMASIYPHELIHAFCFPRDADIEIWFHTGAAMTHSTHPVSKLRFIVISAMPCLVLGVLPLTIACVSHQPSINAPLFFYGALNILFAAGDLMNITNTLIQVPRGAKTQLSGIHSYWYQA
jgi:hypothetical protein